MLCQCFDVCKLLAISSFVFRCGMSLNTERSHGHRVERRAIKSNHSTIHAAQPQAGDRNSVPGKRPHVCIAALRWLIPDSDENEKCPAWKMHLDVPRRNMHKYSISIGLENESSRLSHTGSHSIRCWTFHDIQVKTM